MPYSIAVLQHMAKTKSYSVSVRFPDGTKGSLVLKENDFIEAGSHIMGQILLQCWLMKAAPEYV